MRVLVTGAGGFVGRELVPLLGEQGYEVVATDREIDAPGIAGDIGDRALRARLIEGCDAVIHLATVPGGAAEQSPEAARQINIDATMALTDELISANPGARFLFASSIAVFGDPLPGRVDDATPLAPRMLYGAHKAMVEQWLATLSRRGDLSALSLRFPGIVARPAAPSGMKSAFTSNVFHALVRGETIMLPVSPKATIWLISVRQAARSLVQGLDVLDGRIPDSRALTLPALRVRMDALVAEIAAQTGADAGLVSYAPDPVIEAGFGRYPPLDTQASDALGFTHDGDLAALVESALTTLLVSERTTA